MGKVKGGTTGCSNVRSSQPSKHHTLCMMVCSMEQLQVGIILVAGHVDTTFFQQDGACPPTVNVILDVLHDMLCSCVLSNQFPNHFGCGWSWPPCSLDM